MDKEHLLERLSELWSGFTPLASEHPFELGIVIGALGMAFFWWMVSLLSTPRAGKNVAKAGDSKKTKNLAIDDVREKARRRL